MTLAAMIEDGFPHGTVEGYRLGCKRNICPASVKGLSCADFTVRYRGDYAFAKAVNAGEPVESILAREKAAQRAAQAAPRKPLPYKRETGVAKEKRADIRKRHSLGWTDRQIADDLGLVIRYVAHERRAMNLPLVPGRKKSQKGTPDRTLA